MLKGYRHKRIRLLDIRRNFDKHLESKISHIGKVRVVLRNRKRTLSAAVKAVSVIF